MSIDVKYRVRELAKDFGLSSKEITEILSKYGEAPKSTMQVLTDRELSMVFEYLTQHHQMESLAEVYAEGVQPGQKKAETKSAPKAENAGKGGEQKKTEQAAKPATESAPKSRVPQKKVVDTRKAADVNLDRYDQHLEDLAPERAERMQQGQGKQKIKQQSRNRQQQQRQSAKRRQEEQARQMRRLQQEIARKAPVKVQIPDEIAVGELASRMKKTGAEVVKTLMKNGVMASLSDVIDFDTAAIIAEELGCVVEHEVIVTIEERLIDDHEDKEEDLVERAPVVVVMGHVDHGKTSLLDYIRHANVASGEAGGITQAIGAYQVTVGEKVITFLDTPGHEAFTAMRMRGAQCTDIVVLVVAADDGIMPQTIEAINHSKAAGVPIIVAINKMDKPTANPERVKQELTEQELVPEDWGGDTICVPVSAATEMGIDNLLEMILLTAEMKELKANPNRPARGTIIEARLDKGRGPVATLLVQNGTIHVGDTIVAGTAYGRVRAMVNDKGQRITDAGPSTPVEIIGFNDVPAAGDTLYVSNDDKLSRQVAEERREKIKAAQIKAMQKTTLDDLFNQMQEGEMKELNLIVKADVQGSVEAVRSSLEKLSNDEVRVRCIHGGAGAINESDVSLAATSNAIVIGFNVRPDAKARALAEREGVDVRLYRVIYDAIEEIKAAMKGMLAPKFKEVILGHAEVRQTFRVSGVGTIAGCMVTDGMMRRNGKVRLLRDNVVIFEGNLDSLKRFKDDAREVNAGYECGIGLEGYNDMKEQDVIECFVMEEIEK